MYNPKTKTCECPAEKPYLNKTNQCVDCQEDEEFDFDLQSCKKTAPVEQPSNKTNETAPGKVGVPKTNVTCPQDKPYKSLNGTCIACPAPDYWSQKTLQCYRCPTGFRFNP